MDLWELGKGPNGLDRLLSDIATPDPTPGQLSTADDGRRMLAAGVILAIVAANPGCTRVQVDTSPPWSTAPGWGKPADLSTISRNAKTLEEQGLLTRANNQWRVTDKGAERAALATGVLNGQTSPEIQEAAREAEREESDAD